MPVGTWFIENYLVFINGNLCDAASTVLVEWTLNTFICGCALNF